MSFAKILTNFCLKAPPHGQRCIHLSALVSRSAKVNLFNMNFDRRIKVDYKESIEYMNSDAYKQTYDNYHIWQLYRRNHKGQFAPKNTRLTCINDDGFVNTSYPCPICRDEYLVLHHENSKLIEQFINPQTGQVMTPRETGLCLRQHRKLMISIIRARDAGNITYPVPNRLYDYEEYKTKLR